MKGINELIQNYENELIDIEVSRKNDDKAGDHSFYLEYDTSKQNINKFIEQLRKLQALNIANVRLRSILDDRLKSHKDDFERAWKDLESESKYKKEDGIAPFFRLQRMYKIKIQEIEAIIDIYNEA